MAKLGPPNIASMVPSFYTDLNGTTKIVVPFSMNSTVSRAAVSGLLLRIKKTTVDTTVDTLYTENWDDQNFSVTFTLAQDSNTIAKMVKGQYYKLQLAYGSKLNDGTITAGYYSTVAIAKYTEYPAAIVQELEPGVTNSVNQVVFHGRYDNTDVSEKVFQYRFIINSSKRNEITHKIEQKTFLDTDWQVHDSSNDTELSSSIDVLTLTEMFDSSANYTLQYKVLTNNGLEVTSPQYSLQSTVAVGEVLDFIIHTDLDYENGRIKITFEPTGDNEYFTGNYYIERTDASSNFKNWLILNSFQSYDKIRNFIFYDCIIESGMAYKYGIQRINQANILSQRTQSNYPIVGYFEDCFLYDGYRQLKIRYNSNVNSFKEVISETKKTTLGSKYPIIFRNGTLCYKEFQITGLLSYLSDPDELFMERQEILSQALLEARGRSEINDIMTHRAKIKIETDEELVGPRKNPQLVGYSEFRESTEQSDENIAAERNFAMYALSWLNNGTIKLFRSPQEGNFIVKLMNVSLAPMQGTNRMIHTFSATADEIQEFTTDALLKYDLMSKGSGDTGGHTYIDVIKTVDLAQIRESIYATYAYTDENLSDTEKFRRFCAAIEKFDLTDGQPVTKIRFECRKDASARIFKWGDTTFALGVDGTYVMEQDQPYIGSLTVVSYTSSKQELSTLAGKLYLTVRVDTSITIENVASQKVITYLGWSGYGNQLASGASGQSRNLLQDFTGNKYLVTECYKTVTHSYPEYSDTNLAGQWNNNTTTRDKRVLLYDNFIVYHDLSTNKYYRCNVSNKTLYEITPNKRIRTKSPENDSVDITEYGSGGENIVTINYDNLDEVYWTVGNDVYTNFFLAVNKINYSIEDDADLNPLKVAANNAKREWFKYTFNLTELGTKPTASENKLLFIWSGDRFVQISLENWNNYVNDYTIYTIYAGVYSTTQINTAYNNYRTAEVALETGIKNQLETASGEGS